MELLKHSNLPKGVTGPILSKARRRHYLLLSTFLVLALTAVWSSWVRTESTGFWFSTVTETNASGESSDGQLYRPTPLEGWIQYPNTNNDADELLRQLRNHAVSECRTVETRTIHVLGLPRQEPGNPIRLTTGVRYKLLIVSFDDSGKQLCEGGDYYETDLSGVKWKSRPPVEDLQDGTYEVQLQMDERFAGLYKLKVFLLYSRFHGLELVEGPSRFHRGEEVASVDVLFEAPDGAFDRKASYPRQHMELNLCSNKDYALSRWSGRWTRSQNNESCTMDSGGRYQCLPPNTECERPWCEGPIDRVDSNGWVYSAHCRFKLFTADEAWQCLDKKWLFSWGDSTSQHTWQNLLAFVMDYADISVVDVPRRMDREWVRPQSENANKERQSLRLTMVYNGHANEEGMFQGLQSLAVPQFREFLRGFFVKPDDPTHAPPDILVMNSGLHDAFYYGSPEHFVREGLLLAIDFWKEILDTVSPKVPQLIYRTSVATAGKARSKEYNPQKIEHYNRLFVDSLKKLNQSDLRIVDGFDLTFPWHYDNNFSDGTHYGLKPNLGVPGHHYFVDHMFAHMLLNSICIP